MATRYGVNCVSVAPGGPIMATIQDVAFSQCHELVIMETFSGTGDPTAGSSRNRLPTQFVKAQQIVGNTNAGGADSGNGVKISGVYNSSPPSLTSGWRGDAQLDSSGNLKVNIAAGGGAGGTSSTFGAALPNLGTAIGAQSSAGS